MVIDDFDVPCRTVAPSKADAELVVDADAPLSAPIAGKLLQPVLRRDTQSFDPSGGIQHLKLSHCHASKVGKTSNAHSVEQGFGIPALERLDHGRILTCGVSIVKHRRRELVPRRSRCPSRGNSRRGLANESAPNVAVGANSLANSQAPQPAYAFTVKPRCDSATPI